MEVLTGLLAAFVFEGRFGVDGGPGQPLEVAQLEAAGAGGVVLQGGLREGEKRWKFHRIYYIPLSREAVLKIADFYALWCQADMMSLWEFP
jgi:hypothetical protein